MIKTFAEALLSAEAAGLCGAADGERCPDRVTKRDGYRHRGFAMGAGPFSLAIPKLRRGTYFPDWRPAVRRGPPGHRSVRR